MFTEDEAAYGISWTQFQGDSKQNNSSPEFTYSSASTFDGYPYMGNITWYSGGGYAHIMRGSEENMLDNIEKLKSLHWIEFGTRAVIVQFTVYNPNVNLFGIITVLFEMPGVGALIPSYRIEIANLFGVMGSETKWLDIAFQVSF